MRMLVLANYLRLIERLYLQQEVCNYEGARSLDNYYILQKLFLKELHSISWQGFCLGTLGTGIIVTNHLPTVAYKQ